MPAPAARKTILIVDDHPVLRRGLAALIESESELAVCGEAATAAAALAAIREHRPDLVIVDLELAGSDGLDLIKAMKTRHPHIPALVLSMHDEAVYAERALRAGARGYVTKQQLDDTVLIAIRRLLGGEMYMSDTLKARLAAHYVGGRTLATDSRFAPRFSGSRTSSSPLRGRQKGENLPLAGKESPVFTSKKLKPGITSAAELAHRAAQWVESGHTG